MDALKLIRQAETSLRDVFSLYQETAYTNQTRVLKALQRHRVRESFFATSTGYGYGDMGRDELESIYAEIMETEDAMVRSQIVSGTHAIAACLLALLRPGDELLSVLGSPYDTLCQVIGKKTPDRGTLIDRGIIYNEVPLNNSLQPDPAAIARAVNANTRLVLIQRSRGYSLRPSLRVEDIEILVKTIRSANPVAIILVDNCYGEFTDVYEPSRAGADLMAGSLIKNPGGGLAPSGGYIAGRKDLVEEVSYQLTAPGLGKALGASLVNKRALYQGLFMAPHTVMQAMQGAALLAYVFARQGFEVYPRWEEKRGDIVQAVKLNNAEQVINFCQIVQSGSPVDSDVTLEYGQVPGYTDRIVMAAGTFIQGSSIELSCDAPLREPYVAYFQGGLTYEHVRFVVKELIEGLLESFAKGE
ncbi:MAG: methionine gamma-lyase family protein [Syntrophomonadaceae bacterium]|nr:methionine gamma-lyase family protein [Syntrophomonadaceae bacterium]